jgi:hypothetical protein
MVESGLAIPAGNGSRLVYDETVSHSRLKAPRGSDIPVPARWDKKAAGNFRHMSKDSPSAATYRGKRSATEPSGLPGG